MRHLTRKAVGPITAAALGLGGLAAQAQDVEFMNWTYTEETGKAAIQGMVDDFAAETGLTVEPEGYAWGEMNKNYLLRARSNALPDVGQSQERLLPVIAGIPEMQDLNEVFGKERLEELFDPAFLAMGQIDGKQLALPWIVGTIGMVANREVLDAAGVTEMPVTVDEFKAVLVKVRDNVPNSVPLGMATKNNASILVDYLTWVWTFGGDAVVDGKAQVNSPEAVAALQFMADAVKDRLAAPEIDRPDARRLFGQGATAFYVDAPQALSFARQFSGRGEAIDAAVVPVKAPVLREGDTPVSIQWGHVMVLFGEENAKPDSAAAQFMMFLLSDDELVDYATGQSVLPATKSGIASEAVTSNKFLSDWAAASVSPRRNNIAALAKTAEVQDAIGEEVQAALLGQKTAQAAADDMQARLDTILAN
jgi:multiple sugar transport system substrate-binding protein